MNQEKRRSRRIDTKVVAHCMKKVEGENLPFRFLSFTKNLSEAGAHLVSAKEVKKGDRFLVTFEIPTSFIPLLTFSEVVWAREDRGPASVNDKSSIEAGIKFLNMDESDVRKLKEYLLAKYNKQDNPAAVS